MSGKEKCPSIRKALKNNPAFLEFLLKQYGSEVSVKNFESDGCCGSVGFKYDIVINGKMVGIYQEDIYGLGDKIWSNYEGIMPGFYENKTIALNVPTDTKGKRSDKFTEVPFEVKTE